jgi:uncharacterized cupin superfamily protein
VSLDYGIVAKGSVVLELEDGERVTLNEGDTVIQRGTMHCWRNETAEWARMYFVGLGRSTIIPRSSDIPQPYRRRETREHKWQRARGRVAQGSVELIKQL